MARSSPPVTAPSKKLSNDEISAGINRLKKRIEELRGIDVSLIDEWKPSSLVSLEKSIEQTLDRVFGINTNDYNRYVAAASLTYSESFGFFVIGGPPTPQTPISAVRQAISSYIERAITLLTQAVEGLGEDLADLAPTAKPLAVENRAAKPSMKVFIVHGHADGVRETVARFLQHMGFQAIILHEQSNSGRTVIEKIEHHGDVGFAVVLLTPDDIGGKQGEDQFPRARQNVILELGYFVGRLGRDKVCALKSGELEVPSDFGGVVYQSMDNGGGWKIALARELKAAGYAINWERMADA